MIDIYLGKSKIFFNTYIRTFKKASELKMGHKSNLMKIVKFKRCRVLAFLLVLLIMFSQERVVLADSGESTIIRVYF